MQCVSCRFENMPGLASCGRCGSVLDLNAAAVDVHPPRASKGARRLRKVVPRKAIYQARDAAAEARRIVTGRFEVGSRVPIPEAEVAARMVVPGWAHVHSGLVVRGRLFLAAYLFFLTLGVLQWGTGPGAALLGLAFSVHASSVLDVLIRQGSVRFPAMMATAGVVSVALALLVYVPAGWVLTRLASPVHYDHDAEPFRRLDVVLVNRWAFAWRGPRLGDVVLFRPTIGANVAADYTYPRTRLLIDENALIDRVLGRPGDRVIWDRGKLSVNGAPVPLGPLISRKLPPRLAVNVPAGRYLILPTSSRAMREGHDALYWTTVGLVAAEDIEGGAFLRNSPFSRFWIIR